MCVSSGAHAVAGAGERCCNGGGAAHLVTGNHPEHGHGPWGDCAAIDRSSICNGGGERQRRDHIIQIVGGVGCETVVARVNPTQGGGTLVVGARFELKSGTEVGVHHRGHALHHVAREFPTQGDLTGCERRAIHRVGTGNGGGDPQWRHGVIGRWGGVRGERVVHSIISTQHRGGHLVVSSRLQMVAAAVRWAHNRCTAEHRI